MAILGMWLLLSDVSHVGSTVHFFMLGLRYYLLVFAHSMRKFRIKQNKLLTTSNNLPDCFIVFMCILQMHVVVNCGIRKGALAHM